MDFSFLSAGVEGSLAEAKLGFLREIFDFFRADRLPLDLVVFLGVLAIVDVVFRKANVRSEIMERN